MKKELTGMAAFDEACRRTRHLWKKEVNKKSILWTKVKKRRRNHASRNSSEV